MAKPKIRWQQATAQYYSEDLGDGVELDMILIPGGSFLMGTEAQEIERLCKIYDTEYFRAEKPQHQVKISTFFMGRYPITQEQWRIVAGWEKVDRELKPDPSYFKEPFSDYDRWTRPVERISWDDAQEFCARLKQKTGRAYCLPIEAQWEYACRAGTTTPFHFGETIITDLANYRGTDHESIGWKGSYGEGPKGEYREQTTPVEYFQVANKFGLCEMHGNVWEWCEDGWHENYKGAPTDESAWLSDDNSTTKVLRGGSWGALPDYCRCASRFSGNPGFVFNGNIGLRVVCVVPRTM
ncbi:MAG: formylglycine-generating enzyme family protein [Symploca sp. SIO3C6]|nr:formylglycine-generating enzyme family protein [Symploca sp. SIO3C6]